MTGREKALTNSINDNLFKLAQFDETAGERTGYSNYSYWRSTWQVFTKNKTAFVLLIILAVVVLFTVIQPFLPDQYSPIAINIDPATGMQFSNQPPSKVFWFGTNSIGQDLWARIWSGTRTSLLIGLCVAFFEALIGITVGIIWGYARKLDGVLTSTYNVLDNIPHTIILVLFAYIMTPSLFTLLFAMCITSWLPMSRFVRNQIIIIRDREYNLASRCLGTPTIRMLFKNMLPHLVSVIMLRLALAIPAAIVSEVFLTYIGLGLPLSIPSLGNILNEGRPLMLVASLRYQLIIPSVVISIISISFYIMGNAFADAADPRNHI